MLGTIRSTRVNFLDMDISPTFGLHRNSGNTPWKKRKYESIFSKVLEPRVGIGLHVLIKHFLYNYSLSEMNVRKHFVTSIHSCDMQILRASIFLLKKKFRFSFRSFLKLEMSTSLNRQKLSHSGETRLYQISQSDLRKHRILSNQVESNSVHRIH